MYSKREPETRLIEIIQKVWKGERYPQKWREGVIRPPHKKGDKKILKTIGYNIYALVLAERLRK